MFEAVIGFGFLGILCFIFGVVYPAFMLALYPIYRRNGGRKSLRQYMRDKV